MYAPGTVAAAAADVIAQQLIHAYIAVLSSGAPTSSPATIDTTRILAGAGKVTVADADFVASDKVSDGRSELPILVGPVVLEGDVGSHAGVLLLVGGIRRCLL